MKFESTQSQMREFMATRESQQLSTLILQGKQSDVTNSKGHRDDQLIVWSERQESSKERKQIKYALISFGCDLRNSPAWPNRWERLSADKLKTACARALATQTSKAMTALLVQMRKQTIMERAPAVRVFPIGTSSSSTAPPEVVDRLEGPPEGVPQD
jgi:hypothetical protein